MAKKILPLVFIFAAVLLVYFPVFGVYFTGDDFFHFKISLTDGSFLGFVKFFGFAPIGVRGYAFYRPLFREVLYHISYSLFGLEHLPLRVLQIVLHFINISLVWILVKRIFKDRRLAFFVSFFFGIAAANVGSLYYLAGGIQAQGALLFALLTLLFSEKHYLVSLATFVLSLMSHELAVAVLPILVGMKFFQSKKFRVKDYWRFLPHALILALYLYINFFVIGFSQKEAQYQLNFNPGVLANTFSWYGIWALGLPEMLIDYVRSGLTLNPNLIKFWGDYFRIIFPAFVGVAVCLFPAVYGLARRGGLRQRSFWFFVFWFIAGLLPVVFLPAHKQTYYLALSLPAFWVVVGLLARALWEKAKVFFVVLVVSLLALNITSVKLGEKTYWAVQRGKIAQRLMTEIQKKYPTLPKGAKVFWTNDPNYPRLSGSWKGSSNQAYFVLNGSDALDLLYQDPSLQVFYEDRDVKPDDAFVLTARIN